MLRANSGLRDSRNGQALTKASNTASFRAAMDTEKPERTRIVTNEGATVDGQLIRVYREERFEATLSSLIIADELSMRGLKSIRRLL